VGRIFELFAGGTSPIRIAKTLNAEGITGPEGRHWRDTTRSGIIPGPTNRIVRSSEKAAAPATS
jgi:hypothetical protein